MRTFSSLDSGEALLGVATKNPNVQCPKGLDAAGVAGAAIASSVMLATAAATTIGLSLASAGIAAGKAAAEQTIKAALDNSLLSLSGAVADAQAAIGAGPSSIADAKLLEAKDKLNVAQTDAMKLANEKRAGVDAEIADAQAKVANAQKFLDERAADLLDYTENAQERAANVGPLINKAVASKAPMPEIPVSPTLAPKPISALPVGLPVQAKAIPSAIAKPPEALAISSPSILQKGQDLIPLDSYDFDKQMIYDIDQIEQKAILKQAIDECMEQRIFMVHELKMVETLLNKTLSSVQEDVTRLFTIGDGKFLTPLSFMVSNLNWQYGINATTSLKMGLGVNVSSSDFVSDEFKAYKEDNFVGLKSWIVAIQIIVADIYNLSCEELLLLNDLNNNYYNDISSLLVKIFGVFGAQKVDREDKGAILQYLRNLAPMWKQLTDLANKIPQKYWSKYF